MRRGACALDAVGAGLAAAARTAPAAAGYRLSVTGTDVASVSPIREPTRTR